MRVVKGHAQAESRQHELRWGDFFRLLADLFQATLQDYRSLTVDLPFELQHPQIYHRTLWIGKAYLWWGEFWKRVFFMPLYWRNAPAKKAQGKKLRYGNTRWAYIPNHISLFLDTNELTLDIKDKLEAQRRIQAAFDVRGRQIRQVFPQKIQPL